MLNFYNYEQMKVAVPVIDEKVAEYYECHSIQIYEVKEGQYKLVEVYNNKNKNSINTTIIQGRGLKNIWFLIKKGVNVLIVSEIGPLGFILTQEHGVKVYLARDLDVKTALERFIRGELEEIKEPTRIYRIP